MPSQNSTYHAKKEHTWANIGQCLEHEDFPALPNARQVTQAKPEAAKSFESLNKAHRQREFDHVQKQLEQAIEDRSTDRKELEAQIAGLKRSLAEARKLILLLQPPQEASEAQVKELVEDLYSTIEDWVDLECANITDLGERVEDTTLNQEQQKALLRHVTEDDFQLSKVFPQISPNIVMNFILSFLFELCLNEEKWCYGVKRGEEAFLNTLVDAVADRDGTAGVLRSNRWRVETYQALSKQPDRVRKQQDATRVANMLICSILELFVDPTRRPVKTDKFREKIIDRSFKLASVLKSSVSKYRFSFPAASTTGDTMLNSGEVGSLRIIDAETGIEMETHEIEAQGKVLGRLRLCVFPALGKVQDNGAVKNMVKAVVVLEKSTQAKLLNEAETEQSISPEAESDYPKVPVGEGGGKALSPKNENTAQVVHDGKLNGKRKSENPAGNQDQVVHNSVPRGQAKKLTPVLPRALDPCA